MLILVAQGYVGVETKPKIPILVDGMPSIYDILAYLQYFPTGLPWISILIVPNSKPNI